MQVKCQKNCRVYDRLTCNALEETVCGWVGTIHDCFILYAKHLNVPLKRFTPEERVLVIDESDEKFE